MFELSQETILKALNQEANKIKLRLTNQRNHQCILECKAFEEVVDTQMFGFSKQIEFAQLLGLIDKQEGTSLIIKLEQELNDIYTAAYLEIKQTKNSEE